MDLFDPFFPENGRKGWCASPDRSGIAACIPPGLREDVCGTAELSAAVLILADPQGLLFLVSLSDHDSFLNKKAALKMLIFPLS